MAKLGNTTLCHHGVIEIKCKICEIDRLKAELTSLREVALIGKDGLENYWHPALHVEECICPVCRMKRALASHEKQFPGSLEG